MNKTDLEVGMIVEYATGGCGPSTAQVRIVDLDSWMPAYPEQRHIIEGAEVRGYFTPASPDHGEMFYNWSRDYVLTTRLYDPTIGTLLRAEAIGRVVSRSTRVDGQWVPAA